MVYATPRRLVATSSPVSVKSQVLAMIVDAGLDPVQADKIITCESSWKPSAYHVNVDGSNDGGLWQINSVHNLPDSVRRDPIASTRYAIELYRKHGWQPWVCKNKL